MVFWIAKTQVGQVRCGSIKEMVGNRRIMNIDQRGHEYRLIPERYTDSGMGKFTVTEIAQIQAQPDEKEKYNYKRWCRRY
jgi:hypothetical protein